MFNYFRAAHLQFRQAFRSLIPLLALSFLIFCCFFLGAMTANLITMRDQLQEHSTLAARMSVKLGDFIAIRYALTRRPAESAERRPVDASKAEPATLDSAIKTELLRNQIVADYLNRLGIIRDLCRISSSAIRKLNNLIGVGPTKEMAKECKRISNAVPPELAQASTLNDEKIANLFVPPAREFEITRLAREALYLFSTFVLPFFYGMLGSSLGMLRNPDALASFPALFESKQNVSMRRAYDGFVYAGGLAIGGLAGMVIGWFLQPLSQTTVQVVSDASQVFQQPQLSLFPFGIAFLVGYRVEILFRVLDRLEYLALGETMEDRKKREAAEHELRAKEQQQAVESRATQIVPNRTTSQGDPGPRAPSAEA